MLSEISSGEETIHLIFHLRVPRYAFIGSSVPESRFCWDFFRRFFIFARFFSEILRFTESTTQGIQGCLFCSVSRVLKPTNWPFLFEEFFSFVFSRRRPERPTERRKWRNGSLAKLISFSGPIQTCSALKRIKIGTALGRLPLKWGAVQASNFLYHLYILFNVST